MKPANPPLPEFSPDRQQPVTSPEWWPGDDTVVKPACYLQYFRFQFPAGGDPGALP
jgi:hypothetical protein